MSLEKAAAILDAANAANPLVPNDGINPNDATIVKPSEAVKETEFDLKVDSLKEKEPVVEEKKDLAPPVVEEGKLEKKTEAEEKASTRFAMLAKKEKLHFQNVQKLKEREAGLEEKLKTVESFEAAKRQVAKNPMLALEMLGITYGQLTEYQLSGKMPNASELETKSVRDEVADLRKSIEERDRKAAEDQKLANEKRTQKEIAAFQEKIGDYINDNVDKYELINLNEATNLVFQVIERHYKDTKRILSIEDAADKVEKYLEDQVEKNLRAKKLASKVAPPPKSEDTKQVKSAQTRTLTNDMTTSAPSMLPAKTERDRMARALAALTR